MGLLLLLDEESRFVRATEASLKAKFDQHLSSNAIYAPVKGEHLSFRVHHYAGVITYNCSCGFACPCNHQT
jgi:myosin heavy subunit